MNKFFKIICLVTFLYSNILFADSTAVDKVYHPYVQPLEREIEWRMLSLGDEQIYRLALGRSLTDRLFVEGYLIGRDVGDHIKLDAYEVEAKWQLTEQGEYAADWGLLFELEKQRYDDTWEASTGLLLEKEWRRWVGTVNFNVIYEWGPEIKDELETALASQIRYRYKPYLEPAMEFYSNDQGVALGPVLMGDIRMQAAKKLHWELGNIIGLDSKAPDSTWRLLFEYEF